MPQRPYTLSRAQRDALHQLITHRGRLTIGEIDGRGDTAYGVRLATARVLAHLGLVVINTTRGCSHIPTGPWGNRGWRRQDWATHEVLLAVAPAVAETARLRGQWPYDGETLSPTLDRSGVLA